MFLTFRYFDKIFMPVICRVYVKEPYASEHCENRMKISHTACLLGIFNLNRALLPI